MIIIKDASGWTIKHSIESENHVRLDFSTYTTWYWFQGKSVRAFRNRPNGELTLDECEGLLERLGELDLEEDERRANATSK